MTKRTHTIEKKDSKHVQVWEWDETPELKKFIKAQEFRNKHLIPPPERPA